MEQSKIDTHRGVVESIGTRSTWIKRTDSVHLLVPNSQMLERIAAVILVIFRIKKCLRRKSGFSAIKETDPWPSVRDSGVIFEATPLS